MKETKDRRHRRETAEKEEKRFDNVLVSISNPTTAEQLVRLACRITGPRSMVRVANVTLRTNFSARMSSWRRGSRLATEMTRLALRLGRSCHPLAVTAGSIPDALITAARDTDADLIVMGWFGRITPLRIRRSRVVNKVLHRAGCDTAVFKLRGRLQDVERVVLPVGLDFNPERLAVVRAMRRSRPVEALLVQVLTPGMGRKEEKAREILDEYARRLTAQASIRVVRARRVVRGVLDVVGERDLVVIGPGREWVFDRFLFGRRADQITNRAPCSVLLYKSRELPVRSWIRALVKAAWSRLARGRKI